MQLITRSPSAFDWWILDVVIALPIWAAMRRCRRTDGRSIECASCAGPGEQNEVLLGSVTA
jgi:hypothetical protein